MRCHKIYAVLGVGFVLLGLFFGILIPVHAFTPLPTISGSRVQAATGSSPFVQVCGLSLCLNGHVWYLYGGSTNGATTDANARMDMAVQGHLNTVRLTDWLHNGDAYQESQWRLVDAMIAAAQTHGLHILLDLSTYGGVAQQLSGGNAYTYDWGPFLKFVLTRKNTVSGVQYANDPTIALFAIAGEVPPLNTPSNTLHITTQQVNDFFKRTAAEFKALDKNHLLEPGGLYQLGWNSGVDYKTIFAIPVIDVCAVHAPKDGGDAPLTSQYCQSIGKPWIWEEFSQPQGIGDQARADWFQSVYSQARQLGVAGASFWNLGPGTGEGNDDVGPQTSLTWATVVKNAPAAPVAPSPMPTVARSPATITITFMRGGVSPAPVSPGSREQLRITLTASAPTSALINFYVDDATGHTVTQQWVAGNQMLSGKPQTFVTLWSVPATLAAGTYRLKVGVFRPNWGPLYGWDDAGAFQVGPPTLAQGAGCSGIGMWVKIKCIIERVYKSSR